MWMGALIPTPAPEPPGRPGIAQPDAAAPGAAPRRLRWLVPTAALAALVLSARRAPPPGKTVRAGRPD